MLTHSVIESSLIDILSYRDAFLGAVCAYCLLCVAVASLDYGGTLQYSHM